MKTNAKKIIGSAVMASVMVLSGCAKNISDIKAEEWRDEARKNGVQGTSDIADHVTDINWIFCDAIKGDGYYTNNSGFDLTVNFDQEVDGLYYTVLYDGVELCRKDVPQKYHYDNPGEPGVLGPYDEAQVCISFYDLYKDRNGLTPQAEELVSEYGSIWYLKTLLCPGEYEIDIYDEDDELVWTLYPHVDYQEEGPFFKFTDGASNVIGRADSDDDTFAAFSDMICLYNGFSLSNAGWNTYPACDEHGLCHDRAVSFVFTTDIAPEDLAYHMYYQGSSTEPFRGSVFDGYKTPEARQNPNGTYTYTISFTGTEFYGGYFSGCYVLPDGYFFLRITSADGSNLYAETMFAYGNAESGMYMILA